MINKLGVDFEDIGQVSYSKEDIANLKKISTKIKNKKQASINPLTGKVNALNLPSDDKDLTEIPLTEEEVKKIDEYINPDSNPETIKENDSDLFDNYHNFYINFFKYLKYFFGKHLTKGRKARTGEIEYIKNFSFNYGSQIMSSFDYYNGASYELPFANITLIDIRPLDNVQYISRQCLGKTPSNNIIIAENKNRDEVIFTSVQYNYINISVEINFESSSELLDYISNLNIHIPPNFTVYGPKYYNYINVSSITKAWKNTDTYYGLNVIPSNTYDTKKYTYGKLEFEPNLELSNVSQSVSKDDNTNTLTLDFIFGTTIPTNVYKKTKHGIHKITLDINTSMNDKIMNSLPLLNTLTAESFIDVTDSSKLKLGQKSATIKETILLNTENFLYYNSFKILAFGTSINLLKTNLNNTNFSGIGFWRKKNSMDDDDLLKNTENFIPLNYLFKGTDDTNDTNNIVQNILYRLDSTLTDEENLKYLFNGGNLDLYGNAWKGIYNYHSDIFSTNTFNKVFRFIILPKNNKDDIKTLEQNLKDEVFPEGTNFQYLIKSKYLLAEADEVNNPKNYYNSILLYN